MIHNTQPIFEDGPFAAGSVVNVSNKAGLQLSDRQADDHNYALQISVEFEGLPGYWYFFARSPVSHYDAPSPGSARTGIATRAGDHRSNGPRAGTRGLSTGETVTDDHTAFTARCPTPAIPAQCSST